MAMLKELLNRFVELLTKPEDRFQEIEVGKNTYFVKGEGFAELLPLHNITPILHKTLKGLVEYLNRCPEDCAERLKTAFINIESSSEVSLVTAPDNLRNQRQTIFRVDLPSSWQIEKINFLRAYHSQSEFIINLLTWFKDTPARVELLKVIGNLADSSVLTSADDGVTQRVEVSKGVAFKEIAKLEHTVKLQPFSTFREIVQPERLFLLRVRGGNENNPPSIALFPADGSIWQLEANIGIAKYLSENIESNIPIIG